MAKPTTTIQMLFNALFVILVGFTICKSFQITGSVAGDDHWKRLKELEAKQRAALGDQTPATDLPARQLAETLWQEGKFPEAEKLLVESSPTAKPTGYDPTFVDKMLSLAAVSLDNADFARAIEHYELILTYDRKMLGNTSRETARDLNNLGVASYLLGQASEKEAARQGYFAKALDYYSQAEDITRRLGNDQETLWRLKRIVSNHELANQKRTKANQIPFDRLRSPNNDML
jgi:tetratricopeptide (TPR) repeat protein